MHRVQTNLQRLFEPRSIAIVGASPEPKKIPGMIVDFLRKSGFAGKVYPVNPRYEKIHEFTCYPNVDALPETPDLVVVVIPVAVAFDAVEAAARRGVPFCLLMSGGFGEGRTGDAGRARHARLLESVRQGIDHVPESQAQDDRHQQAASRDQQVNRGRNHDCPQGGTLETHARTILSEATTGE